MTMEKNSFLYLLLPMIVGLLVVGFWIQIAFLGLLGGPARDEVRAAYVGLDTLKQAIIAKREAMGPWILHTKLALTFILITSLLIMIRFPFLSIHHIPKVRQGESLTYVGVLIIIFALPINFLFCRYYCCRPAVKSAITPSLLTWRSCNAETPWGHILMLTSTNGFIMGTRQSGLFKLIGETLVRQNFETFGSQFWGSVLGLMFTTIAPATSLAKYTLFDMLKAVRISLLTNIIGNKLNNLYDHTFLYRSLLRQGGALESGRGTFAIPYTIALYNQFLLPISSSANTVVSGLGNVRPYQFVSIINHNLNGESNSLFPKWFHSSLVDVCQHCSCLWSCYYLP